MSDQSGIPAITIEPNSMFDRVYQYLRGAKPGRALSLDRIVRGARVPYGPGREAFDFFKDRNLLVPRKTLVDRMLGGTHYRVDPQVLAAVRSGELPGYEEALRSPVYTPQWGPPGSPPPYSLTAGPPPGPSSGPALPPPGVLPPPYSPPLSPGRRSSGGERGVDGDAARAPDAPGQTAVVVAARLSVPAGTPYAPSRPVRPEKTLPPSPPGARRGRGHAPGQGG